MTVAFVLPPAHGHVNPTLPVMRELVSRGERVVCYDTDEFRPQIERTGATFRAYPVTDVSPAVLARLLQGGRLIDVTLLILRGTRGLVPFMIDSLAGDRPDLVVFDSVALWGKMAASRLRIPAAASITHFVMDHRQLALRDLVPLVWQVLPSLPALLVARRRLARDYPDAMPAGHPIFPLRDRLNILFTTPELQPVTPIIDSTFRFVGPSIDARTRADVPALDPPPATGPLVYIALGTIQTAQPAFYRACFEAFDRFPATFVLSIGTQTVAADLGAVPRNFVVRPVVPQLEVLERADAFISHGGLNSVHEALYFGVPLVVLPHHLEQLLNARAVAQQGAGVVLEERLRGRAVTPGVLRAALETVLSNAGYRQAAARVQQSLRASGGYGQAAGELQAYAAAATPTSASDRPAR
jgi:MGT family glycosyltransferase